MKVRRRRISFFRTCAGLLILLMAGCQSSRQAASEANGEPPPGEEVGTPADVGDAPSGPPDYTYRINPFPIMGAQGDRLSFPFLGGLMVPRPQLIDIDDDGDVDLFLQEANNRVMFFENTGSGSNGSDGRSGPRPDASTEAPEVPFAFRTFKYHGLDIGEWYRFTDLDYDGDPDLLAESPYNYVRYYQNVGAAGSPEFELVVDTLKDVDGKAIFSDRQNIPNVTDVDCDGHADLFLGRLDGTITRYEAVSGNPAPTPRFRLVTKRFEDIRIVGELGEPGAAPPQPNIPGQGPSAPQAGPIRGHHSTVTGSKAAPREQLPPPPPPPPHNDAKHGANTMAFLDVDDDGDPDLLWGDYFEAGLLLIENVGSCRNPVFEEPRPFPPSDPLKTSGYNAPTGGDLDGDGDMDLLVGVIGGAFNPSATARQNFYQFENTGTRYALRDRQYLDGIDVGSESAPAAGDLDGDGDIDLLVANKTSTGDEDTAHIVRYENVGAPAAPEYMLVDTLDVTPGYNASPVLGDLNGDGDPDLVMGTWNNGLVFYEGAGGAAFSSLEDLAFDLARGSHTAPALGDLDGDTDLDLVIGETAGTLSYYRNTGTPETPQFELDADMLVGMDVGRRSVPTLVDLNDDGLLDLVIGSDSGGFVRYLNTGTQQEPAFEESSRITTGVPLPSLVAPVFADVDGDSDQDLISGTGRGGLLFFEK